MTVKMCETSGCSAKLEYGVSWIFQRSNKDGKHILVCRKCALRMDGKGRESDYKFIKGEEREVDENEEEEL